jgi:hypothetical protein
MRQLGLEWAVGATRPGISILSLMSLCSVPKLSSVCTGVQGEREYLEVADLWIFHFN